MRLLVMLILAALSLTVLLAQPGCCNCPHATATAAATAGSAAVGTHRQAG